MTINFEARVPKPLKRNPFKVGSILARQFDGMLKGYADGNRDIIRNGSSRCMGNSLATAFWRGYDSTPPLIIPRNALTWACYRAGQAQRMIDAESGVYVAR